MKNNKNKFGIIFWIILIAISNNILTQTQPDSALKAFQIKPLLELTTYQSNYIVSSQLTIRGRIVNLTDVDIFLLNAELELPGEYSAARRDSTKEVNRYANKDFKEQKLVPGSEYPLNFTIPYKNLSWYSNLFNSNLLLFQPKSYEFNVILKYRIATRGKTSVQKLMTLTLEPPMSSLIWGGIIGSFLLAIFLSSFKYLRESKSNILKDILIEWVKLFITGAITAIILVFIIYRYKELQLPINITVNDFFGGVVLGLFTYSLGDWLYRKLREEVKPTEQTGEEKPTEQAEEEKPQEQKEKKNS